MNRITSRFLVFCSLLSSLPCLTACQWESRYTDKAFLSFKYRLEACADIHGQDPYAKTWFSEYEGTDYTALFDLSFEKTYLDFRVVIESGRAVGKGHIRLSRNTGIVYEDREFEYYCSAADNNFGGAVFAAGVTDSYETWVYSIYWCRLNMHFTHPDTEEQFVMTFHFRGGEWNPYPEEFQKSS